MTRFNNKVSGVKKAAGLFHRRLCFLVVLVLWGLSCSSSLRAADPSALPEFQVKAAFLINFPKYVDWPAEAFAETNSPIVIAVLGESRVTDELEKGITGRTINGRAIVLKHLVAGEPLDACHILFIPAAEKHASVILARLKDAGVLTVGESGDFLDSGGIINLARRDQKIALEVNLPAAGKAGIKISSKLLNVAQVVKGRTN